MKIAKVKPLVYEALVNNPAARGDDFILIHDVLKHFVSENMTMDAVLTYHAELGVPSFASIIRIRRKIQEQDPTLNPSEKVIKMRKDEEQKYRDFARGVEN